MKTKIVIAFMIFGPLFSCNNSVQKAGQEEHGEHESHDPEGVVMLSKQQREALGLKIGPFGTRNLTTLVKTNGQLEVPPAASAEVTAIIGGNVKEIKVFHGDKVCKGQVLTVLEHPDYIVLQEEFAEMANRLEYLEQEYNRQKELFENNVGAGKDFQQAKSEYNTAKAKYEGLKSRLQLLNLLPGKVKNGNISNTITITSPINGYVNKVNIKVGTYADAQSKLFDITDNSKIHADFMVYENDVHLLKNGQKIDFAVANRPDEELSATIFAIGKAFETNTRAVHIHAKLDSNPGNLIPGMYVSGHIHTDKIYTRALPNDAVVTEGTKSFIFVVDKPIKAEERDNHDHAGEHEGHDHTDEHEVHEHAAGSENGEHGKSDYGRIMAFRMVEVITGKTDGGYTGIKLLNPLPEDTKVALNAAYYLLSDLKKEENEHEH